MLEIFRKERKTIRPSMRYQLVAIAEWFMIFGMFVIGTLCGFAAAFTPNMLYRNFIASLLGFSDGSGNHIIIRLIMGVWSCSVVTQTLCYITFYLSTAIGFLQVVKFWLHFLQQMDSFDEREILAYRILTHLMEEANRHGKLIIPCLLLAGQALIVISLFGDIKLFEQPIQVYIIFPTCTIISIGVAAGLIPQATSLHTTSNTIIAKWKNQSNKYKKRVGLSFRPISCKASLFFSFKSSTTATFMQIALDTTADLLVSF